jgi:phosphatidylglycerophosphate synthase
MPNAPDRRPIASRNLPLFQNLASLLARAKISANLISLLGMFAALLGAAMLISTSHISPFHARLHFLLAAILIQLRLLANMLDGMVALASQTASTTGELFNEIPDRISDTALLAAAGYALHSDPALGWAAACVALFVTYIRALGKSLGIPVLFHGPMSKSHRMFLLTLTCLYLAFAPDSFQPTTQLPWPNYPVGIMALALAIIILGGILTAFRRLAKIVRSLKERPQ